MGKILTGGGSASAGLSIGAALPGVADVATTARIIRIKQRYNRNIPTQKLVQKN